jgi:hypothetical protein
VSRPASLRALAGYYLATPLFALIDVLWGVSVRAIALDAVPGLKYAYYAACLALGLLATVRPGLAGIVAASESSVNLALVIMSIPVAYLGVLQGMLDGGNVRNPFTPEFFANFAISAGVALTAYYRTTRGPSLTRR